MRLLGTSLLIIGFFWITWDAAESFVGYQHMRWIWQSQHLPVGDIVQRTDAVGAMRELSLALKNRHRLVVIPALLMLIGGLIGSFSRTTPTTRVSRLT